MFQTLSQSRNKPGKGYVFDDSFLHEAWHNGTETRVILIADFWHKDLSDLEVKFLSFLLNVGSNKLQISIK